MEHVQTMPLVQRTSSLGICISAAKMDIIHPGPYQSVVISKISYSYVLAIRVFCIVAVKRFRVPADLRFQAFFFPLRLKGEKNKKNKNKNKKKNKQAGTTGA